jgi:hypothetical protein
MHPEYDMLFVTILPLVMMLALAVTPVVRHGLKSAALATHALAQVAALLLLGLREETRNLL